MEATELTDFICTYFTVWGRGKTPTEAFNNMRKHINDRPTLPNVNIYGSNQPLWVEDDKAIAVTPASGALFFRFKY